MHADSPVDALVVDVGARGLRARRGGETAQARVDIPRLRLDDGLDVDAALSAVAPLVEGHETPPATTVWSLPLAGRHRTPVDAPTLLARSRQAFGTARTVVVDAAVTTLVGALDEVAPGVVLDMGVSATALATDFDQTWHRVDGWGPVLGDRGSAAWIGAQGLAAALRQRDGVPGGSVELLRVARHAFGDERTWVDLLTCHGTAEVLADFAPLVGDAVRRDVVAEEICRLAGEHLAETMCAGSRLLPGVPLAATGALLLVDAVKAALAKALGRRCVFVVPAFGDSLAGAHVLAAHLASHRPLRHRPPFTHVDGHSALASG